MLNGVITRTPESLQYDQPTNMDAIAWQAGIAEANWKRMDARDWIYQSWAYDQHNVGTTPGFNGDAVKALKSIKAKTLVLAGEGDLLNPEANAKEAAQYIPDARYVTIGAAISPYLYERSIKCSPLGPSGVALEPKIESCSLRRAARSAIPAGSMPVT